MQPFWKKDAPHPLDKSIADIVEYMERYGPTDPDYPNHVKHLSELMKLRNGNKPKRQLISWDTLLIVGGNVIIALIVTRYEDEHVLTSKAKDYVMNLKAQNPN